MKNVFYSFIHNIAYIFPPKNRESRRFFIFFTAASILEFTLSKIVLLLAKIGLYDPFAALKITPLMTESAVLSLFLAVIFSVVLDFTVEEKTKDF